MQLFLYFSFKEYVKEAIVRKILDTVYIQKMKQKNIQRIKQCIIFMCKVFNFRACLDII